MGNFRWQVGGCGCDCLPPFGSCTEADSALVNPFCLFGVGLSKAEALLVMEAWSHKYSGIFFHLRYAVGDLKNWFRIICDHSIATSNPSDGDRVFYDFPTVKPSMTSISSTYAVCVKHLEETPPGDNGIVLCACQSMGSVSYEPTIKFTSETVDQESFSIVLGDPIQIHESLFQFPVTFEEKVLAIFGNERPPYKRRLESFSSSRVLSINSYVSYFQPKKQSVVGVESSKPSSASLAVPSSSTFPLYGKASYGSLGYRYYKGTVSHPYVAWDIGTSTVDTETPDSLNVVDNETALSLSDKKITRSDNATADVGFTPVSTSISEDEFLANATEQNTILLSDYKGSISDDTIRQAYISFLKKEGTGELLETYPVTTSASATILFYEADFCDVSDNVAAPADRALCTEKQNETN